MVPRSNLSTDCRRIRSPDRDGALSPIGRTSSGSGLVGIIEDFARGCIVDRAAWQRAETVNAGEGC